MKTKPFFILNLILLVLTMNFSAYSQTIEGDWYGKANLQGMVLRIFVHVTSTENGYKSTWDSPDQGALGIPSSTTSFKYPVFTFTHDATGVKYVGEVNPSYTEITGALEQRGMSFPITFGRNPIAPESNSLEVIKQKYDKKESYITMRDGIRLFTSIYTPKNVSVSHPILIIRTPYNIEPGGPDNFSFYLQVYSRYVDEDYIMVFQDVRGKYMSEGTFEDIRHVIPDKKDSKDADETTDTWDTVDWLVKNVSNNNGNVGIFGISYPGFYSTMSIINAHPAVKAVSPQAPVSEWFIGDDFHHNGAFFQLDCFGFFYSNGQPHHNPTRKGHPGFTWPTSDNYDFFLSMGAVRNFAPKYFGDSIKFWKDAFSHPDYDEFWKSRNPLSFLTKVKPAVMTVGGWFDAEDLYGTLHTYKAIEKQNPQDVKNFLVMGPWAHGQWASGDATHLGNIYWGLNANEKFQQQEKEFFNFYLKGEGTGNLPEAEIFVTGSNEWRSFDKWPPENTVEESLYFQPSGMVSNTLPSAKGGFDEYVSDPMKPVPYCNEIHTERTREYMTDDQRFAARRPDVMVYKTDILNEDITVTGPITADLFVSTTGTDADFVVKLIDVFPDDLVAPADEEIKTPLGGYQMLIRGEIFRGKYRNSFEKPEAFVPGKVTEVKYEMPDVAHTFKKGHRIMIQVQNSWFPLVDRNPQKFVNIYKCSDADFQKATQRIYHDVKYPSSLRVQVLKEK